MKNKGRLWNTSVAISILLCAIIFGEYKRTLSSKLGEIYDDSVIARGFCEILDVVLSDPNHCQKEYADYLEENR